MKRLDEMNYDELEKYREHLEGTRCWRCWGTGEVMRLNDSKTEDWRDCLCRWIKCTACGGTGLV